MSMQAIQILEHPPLDLSFVAFTRALASELGVVRSLVNSPTLSASAIETAARFYPSFAAWLDTHIETLTRLHARIDIEARARHAAFFRETLEPFTKESMFLRRTTERPRGYAGDSEMMRMLYDDQLRGDSVFACLLHRHPVRSAAAQAVRNRIRLLGDVLAAERKQDKRLRVMSLACGPAREIRDLPPSLTDDLDLVLVDQDAEALDEARAEVCRAAKMSTATFVEGSVRNILKHEISEKNFGGKLDVIYSLGLFDYLQRSVAKRLIEELFDMLEPGGRLVIGNFHIACPTRVYLDVWMDWPLLYRTKTELFELAADVSPVADMWIDFESTRSQMFLSLRKR